MGVVSGCGHSFTGSAAIDIISGNSLIIQTNHGAWDRILQALIFFTLCDQKELGNEARWHYGYVVGDQDLDKWFSTIAFLNMI